MATLQQAVKVLKSGDASQRKKALQWLSQSGDERALKALAWAAKNDPDPKLKEYAAKGHRFLKQQLEQEPDDFGDAVSVGSLLSHRKSSEPDDFDDGFGNDSGYYPSYGNDDNDDDDGYQTYNHYDDDDGYDDDFGVGSSDNDGSSRGGTLDYKAKRLINQAVSAHVDGEDEQAIVYLMDAFRMDDRAKSDESARNVASSITGLPPGKAVRAVEDPDYVSHLLTQKDKRKRTGSENDPTWSTAWADIGIFALVNAGGLIAMILLGMNRVRPILTQLVNEPTFMSSLDTADQETLIFLAETLNATVFVLALVAIVYALYLTFIMVVQNLAIHFAAITFFDGSKPSAVTVDKLINVQSMYYGFSYALGLIFVISLPTDLAFYLYGEGGGGFLGIAGILGLLGGVAGIAFGIGQIMVLARVQELSFWNGCLSQFIGGIIFGVVNFILSIVFQMFAFFVSAGSF